MNNLSDDELRYIFEQCASEWSLRFRSEPRMLSAQFPYGQIRRISEIEQRWMYLPRIERRKLACIIQLCDVNSWFLNTWKISLTAGSEFEWQCTLPIISVMEMLLYAYGREVGYLKKEAPFKACINKACDKAIISEHLRDELHIHRNRRNDIHLTLKGYVENHPGKHVLYNQACRSLRKLEKAIKNHAASGVG